MTSRRDRFQRLEPERADPPSAARSGGQPERFQEKEPEAELRVLDLDEGQGFVRCAACRQDHHATAVRCGFCGADLTTREQRAFNEALWKQRVEESAAEEREVEPLRAAQAQAEREMAEAVRQRKMWKREIGLRRPMADSFEEYAARRVVATATRAGRAIGGWLRRALGRKRS